MPVLLIILGAAFLALGIAGGVTYNQWFPISEIEARIAAGLAGILVLALGVYLTMKHVLLPEAKTYGIKIDHPRDDDLPKKEEYDIKIDYPREGDAVDIVDVHGTIGKPLLPGGYTLRVFRIYPGSDSFISIRNARIIGESGKWEAKECDIGGNVGDKREIGVYLVGPNGTVLLDYYAMATRTRSKSVLEGLLKATLNVDIYLPPIEKRTLDMIECHRVRVVRK